jgi:hypothetical protein
MIILILSIFWGIGIKKLWSSGRRIEEKSVFIVGLTLLFSLLILPPMLGSLVRATNLESFYFVDLAHIRWEYEETRDAAKYTRFVSEYNRKLRLHKTLQNNLLLKGWWIGVDDKLKYIKEDSEVYREQVICERK